MANDKIYCSKCGAENEVGSSFCKKCGADLHGTSAEKPSNVWYLLPILFGILGGIIGYIVIKVKDEKMAKNILYVGLGTFVLGIIFIAAVPSPPPVDTEVPISTPTPTPTIPIPEGYYEDECRQPVDVSLLEWLTTYEWANKYERGEWDCSQMTAALEWYLENCRYKTVMQQGTGPGGDGHAWISIWLPKGTELSEKGAYAPKDGYYIYEATGGYFVTDMNQWYGYKTEKQFDDIYAAWDCYKDICLTNGKCGEEAFLDEYGWWE